LRLHPSARKRKVGLAAVVVATLLLSGCAQADQDSIRRLAQPEGVTDRTQGMADLWIHGWVAAMIVGVLVWGLIGYACVKFRRRRDDEIPVQTRYNLPLEILYTVAPVIMVLVFFGRTVEVQEMVYEREADPDHRVVVVGQQWSWTFNYVEDEALDGQTTVYTAGTTAEPPTLVLPVDESVDIELRSPDVIHSFWVPAFLYKLDVIPGQSNSFSFTPTKEGRFEGRCAELCGVYHSRMLFSVEVVSASEYAAHLEDLEQRGNTGLLVGGSEAETQSGLEEENTDSDTTRGDPR
jgi:cytochrome c oxidase subunit II